MRDGPWRRFESRWSGEMSSSGGHRERKSDAQLSDSFLTFVAGKWACPIADIATAWLGRLTREGDTRHLTPDDRGAASAICLLLAVMVESYTLRVAVDQGERPARFRAYDWWKRGAYQHKEHVLDLFVLRDAIAHNHIYAYVLDSEGRHRDQVVFLGGDAKWQQRVDPASRRLKHSQLSVDPGEIGPQDVRTSAEISRGALEFLRGSGQRVGPIDLSHARRGKTKNLWELLDQVTAIAGRRLSVDGSPCPSRHAVVESAPGRKRSKAQARP